MTLVRTTLYALFGGVCGAFSGVVSSGLVGLCAGHPEQTVRFGVLNGVCLGAVGAAAISVFWGEEVEFNPCAEFITFSRQNIFHYWAVMKKLASELFGTFALVFAGTAAIVVNDLSGQVTHVGVSLTFGLIVLSMIYALGDVSGAHLNPAVTIGFFLARRFSGRWVLPYVASQCVGALLASCLLRLLFPESTALGATLPSGPPLQSFILEVVLTLFLMFVILSVSTGAKEKGITAGIAVGAVIALEALFAGPISGASMNPARSLAPALVGWQVHSLWVYLTAPVVGAALAVFTCHCIHDKSCCSSAVPSKESST